MLLAGASALSFGQTSLHERFREIARGVDGTVGVHAMVLETGDTASYNGDLKFPMQSVYKFPIAMAVLDLVDKGKYSLDRKIRISRTDIPDRGYSPIREKYPKGDVSIPLAELLSLTVGESDNTGCDVLLGMAGGPKKADGYIRSLGVKGIAIATTEKEQQVADQTIQYRNWATPRSMTELLKVFHTRGALSDTSTAALMKMMVESTTGPKRLKGLLPAGTVVAHKTGTSSTENGLTAATNDAGIITLPNGRHAAITVFVSDSHASQADREAAIAAIAKAVWDRWAQ